MSLNGMNTDIHTNSNATVATAKISIYGAPSMMISKLALRMTKPEHRHGITVDLLIMHSHWNDLRLMHYDIYATPNMSRVRDFCDLSENVTSTSNVFTCFNVCTSSQRRWAGNWEGFGCTEWHCRELYRFFWSHWRWWRAIDKFWKKKMLCKSIIDMEKC